MTKILIAAAVVSNYANMDAMIGTDGQVYLGRRENYHSRIGEDSPAYYDNSDGSLQLISSNEKMFSFLYGDGWTLSQRQMRREHCLRDGVLSKYQPVQEVTFAGKPFVPPKAYSRRKREQPAAALRKER